MTELQEKAYAAASAYITSWANYHESDSESYPCTDDGSIDYAAMQEILIRQEEPSPADMQAFISAVEACIADFRRGCMR